MTTNDARTMELGDPAATDPDVVGGKGAGIARMLTLGLPVPPAFALTIGECRRYHATDQTIEPETWEAVLAGVAGLERATGRRFGDPESPLLVSVRSAGAVSMPGMMDTVLNLGMTDAVEAGLSEQSGDAGFARSTHARFCQQFGEIVLRALVDPPAAGDGADEVRAAVLEDTGSEIPTEPADQLRAAICAVFDSWSSRRAVAYRKHWGIPEEGGTAVIVQAMVFGNLGGESGTGVLFSRNPLTGEAEPYGEWLPGGQGEDVVSGTHDCLELSELATALPEAHETLLTAAARLEQEHGDMQDIEFTVERGTLHLLQTRSAKRSPAAAVRAAAELVQEGVIDAAEALARVTPEQVLSVLAPRLPEHLAAQATVLAEGTAACPGLAAGVVVGDSDGAVEGADDGDVVLARPTTSPQDVAGMIAAVAVVTERGGSTSHAAVVTRALGKPSVVGVGDGATAEWAGREVTVDGTAGVVYDGRLETAEVQSGDVPGLDQILAWARERCPADVTATAPADGVLDLDDEGFALDPDAEPDVDALTAAMRGAAAVRGSVLATQAGARAVLAAGVQTVVADGPRAEAGLVVRLARAAADE